MPPTDVEVQLSSGERVSLALLHRDSPLALVFLRHLGCIFCRKQITDLAACSELNLVFVVSESPELTEGVRKELRSPHRYICDQDQSLRSLFGLTRGTKADVVHPGNLLAGARALLQGHRQTKTTGDPLQMPGAFVVGIDGAVKWHRNARYVGDNVPAQALIEALAG